MLLAACGGTVMHLGDTASEDGGGGAGSSSQGGASAAGSGGSPTSAGTGGSSTMAGAGGIAGAGGTAAGVGGNGGDIIDGHPIPGPETCDAVKVTPLALTGAQYDRTVRDLLGDVAPTAHRFAAESTDSGFRSVPLYNGQSRLQELEDAATEVAGRVLSHIDALWSCGPSDDPECIVPFLQAFASRAYRRPLSALEGNAVETAFRAQNVGGRLAARNVIASVLADPRFYVFFSGQPGTSGLLDPYAIASRLSYFLTRTTPDAALLAAAAAGELATVEQVRTQAYRLVASPGARDMIRDFFAEWLELDRLDDAKDPAMYPQYTSLAADMRTETLTLGEEVMRGDLSWPALLRYPSTYVNDKLAGFYGIGGVTGSGFQRVSVDGKQRVGFLTQASFLSAHASPASSNPVRRGLFVARRLLCEAIPAPPANVPPLAPPMPLALTTRQRFEVHSSNPCAACHRYLDPVGFGFEHFDAIGQFRATESGSAIDATGVVVNTERGDLTFDGASELLDQLATLPAVPDCLAAQLFRFALQRQEQDGEVCSLHQVQQKLRAGANFRDALVTIATSDAFRYARW